MTTYFIRTLSIFSALVLFLSCSKDDEKEEEEQKQEQEQRIDRTFELTVAGSVYYDGDEVSEGDMVGTLILRPMEEDSDHWYEARVDITEELETSLDPEGYRLYHINTYKNFEEWYEIYHKESSDYLDISEEEIQIEIYVGRKSLNENATVAVRLLLEAKEL